LRENDVIKLGRVKFRVRELHVSEEIEGQQNDSGIDEISELVLMMILLNIDFLKRDQKILEVLKKICLNNIS